MILVFDFDGTLTTKAMPDYMMKLRANRDTRVHKSDFSEWQKEIVFFPGVVDFLENSPHKKYIISGGVQEYLEQYDIAKHFDGIYGTRVSYDDKGMITGLVKKMTDESKVDAIREILGDDDCTKLVFIGDGLSDIPAMQFVHANGGKVVMVKHDNDEFYSEGMVDLYCDGEELFKNKVLTNFLTML